MVHTDPPPFVEAILDALAGAPVDRARARWSAHPAAPWHAWLLVALARLISAQRWGLRLWRGPLAAAVATADYRKVPGTRGWHYQIRGARLTLLGPESVTLEVDDYGDDGRTIHAYCFTTWLVGHEAQGLPEQRLLDLLPIDPTVTNDDIVHDAIEQLSALGLVRAGEHENTFRIASAIEDVADTLAHVDFSTPEARAHWAEHLGDHLLLADARAPAQRLEHERYLVAGLERMPGGFLLALEPLLAPAEFVDAATKVIDGLIGPDASGAIAHLEEHPDYPVCPAVARLLERADPERDYPYPIYVAARYLLRRRLDRSLALRVARRFAEVEAAVGCDDNPIVGYFALLLLEHAPAYALPAIRRGLRMGDAGAQRTVATALGVLDQPWCHRELFRALNEATMFEGTAALRAALVRSSAPRAREVVEQWERTHVQLHPPATTDPPRTWGELLEVRAVHIFDQEAKELRPWADKIRPTIDPNFDKVASA